MGSSNDFFPVYRSIYVCSEKSNPVPPGCSRQIEDGPLSPSLVPSLLDRHTCDCWPVNAAGPVSLNEGAGGSETEEEAGEDFLLRKKHLFTLGRRSLLGKWQGKSY